RCREVAPDFGTVRRAARGFLQGIDGRLWPVDGAERARQIGPWLSRRVIEIDRFADELDCAGVIAGLMQHDARIMQRRRMVRLLRENARVTRKRFAQLALPMQAKRFIQRGGERHAFYFAGPSTTE